jgi:hypothetical protein
MDITTYLTECVLTQTPVAFLKYGDGEHSAANHSVGHNCDNDTYTESLSENIRSSFTYMVDEAPNTYIGIWHDGGHIDYWTSIVKNPIRTVKYHTLILDTDNRPAKIQLFKAIKESPLKKIYVCNPLMVRAKPLLNIDYMVHVPFNNWFDTLFSDILHQIEVCMKESEQHIILISAGMGAKVLVAELSKRYPQNIYLDIGSGLDKICTKKTTRGWEPYYHELVNEFREILPPDWESADYQPIFDAAKKTLGIHQAWLIYE